MCLGVLPAASMSVHHVCAVPAETGRGHWIFLNWSYITIVSHHVGTGVEFGSYWKSSQCSQPLGHLYSPSPL